MGDIEKSNRRPPWRRGDRGARAYRPGPFALVYSALLAAGLVAAGGVYYVLVHRVPGMAANRADTMKTALLVIGGSGALAGLYVAYRKQRTDEANHLRDQDKLFTERYTAAAAQLGHDKAAVRLAGVYALARIADDSERDRPTCISVLCAYLRMPYDPDDPKTELAERQVRTTAQTAIAERLRPDHPGFWFDARIDLSGAYLTEATFSDIIASTFRVSGATFGENVTFEGATFAGFAAFDEATFHGEVNFRMATFSTGTWFKKAIFRRTASFQKATFERIAMFYGATFHGTVRFSGATFNGEAWFDEATFHWSVWFSGAKFPTRISFRKATFRRDCPPSWPDGFAEPAEIGWADPPNP